MEIAKNAHTVLITLWASLKAMLRDGGIIALEDNQLLTETICWDLGKESESYPAEII